jgi:general stress protein 26
MLVSVLDHVSGLDALPLVARALARFEPAVLLTSEGLGAIHVPLAGDGAATARTFWFLADARSLREWEAQRQRVVTLCFHSPDERVYLTITGRSDVVADRDVAAALWRPAFTRWFSGGPADPRLLLVRFTTDDAEFYETSSGRVVSHLAAG